MTFVDALIILVLVLILVVIVYNLFVYGRDLAIFPRKHYRRNKKRREEDYYPGSIADDYDSDYDSDYEDSDSDARKNKKRVAKRKHKVNPQKVADYVSNHMPFH